MATGHDIAALKKEAVTKMDQGRFGLEDEIQRLRVELSPSRMAHKVMDQHTLAVLAATFGLGVILPLVMFRSHPAVVKAAAPAPTPPKGSFLNSLFGQVVSVASPFLIKSLANRVLNSLVPSGAVPHGNGNAASGAGPDAKVAGTP